MASMLQFQGRLRHIVESWQGQDVCLKVTDKKIVVQPEYLNQQCSIYTNHINNKFTCILKKQQNVKQTSSNKWQYAKENVKNNCKNDDFVFNAYERSKDKKGKSFSQLAQKYKSYHKNQNKHKIKSNKTTQNVYQFQFPKQQLKRKVPKYIIPDEQLMEQTVREQIQQSLKGLRINNQTQSQNNKIINKIQNLKKQIIQKLMEKCNQSQQGLAQLILEQIKITTQKIISNYSKKYSQIQYNPSSFHSQQTEQPILQKPIFSFQGAMKNGLIYQQQQQEEQIKQNNENQQIKIPKFKEQNKSISSILSFNDINSPQIQKKQKIYIIEAEDKRFNKQVHVKDESDNKIQEIKPFIIQYETPQTSALNDYKQFQKLSTATQKADNLQKVEQIQKQNKAQNKTTIKNYNIQFIDSRVKQTQVIRLSPLRFRKKQEVVRHLVKHRIVQKQSDSIEFVN